MRSSQLKPAAYHEAGHAVVWLHFGGSVESVTTFPSDTSRGQVAYGKVSSHLRVPRGLDGSVLEGLEVASKHIITDLAGLAAQRHHRPESCQEYHGHSDYVRAEALAVQLSRGNHRHAQVLLEWLAFKTDFLVQERLWSRIELVVGELLRRRRLTGLEVEAVLSGTPEGGLGPER